jgi:hypothetical protein
MSGMGLRDYRVHPYDNAFCLHCHAERPDRPLAEVRRLSGWLAVRNDRVWLDAAVPTTARSNPCTTSRPRC